MRRNPENQDNKVRAVKSAERVLDILVLLAQSNNGLKLKDIAHTLNIPVSSLHAILSTMKNRGFIVHENGSVLYKLSHKVYQIVPSPSSSQTEDDLVSIALPIMDKVRNATQETISLSVRIGSEIVFIGKRSSSSIIQVVNALGSRLPAHATGSGKVMLSYLSEEEIDLIYPQEELLRVTTNTIKTKNELKRELSKIRELGYAYDNEESIEDVWAVAGCIHGPDGRPLAATSIVVPLFRVTQESKIKWSDIIVGAAAEITSRLVTIAAGYDRLGRILQKK
jgi:IclR family KDG regulon transcriptional repressor